MARKRTPDQAKPDKVPGQTGFARSASTRIPTAAQSETKNPKPPIRRAPDRTWTSWLIYVSILAAALAAYWPALNGGFVWDDNFHVTASAMRSLHGLWRIWFDLGATEQYYPLLHSAFWFEHRLWGDAVMGYHLANLAQHALAACLVVLIVRRLALPGAWLAGLIFALHPVCVESVAWISEQKSTLSAVFYLTSALVYLRFDQTRRGRDYLWALGLFVLALLSKTVTATLPATLLVIFWWQRGHLDWRRDVRPLLPWFGFSVTAGLLTAWVERHFVGAEGAAFALSPVQRLLLAGRAICFYAGKLIWPANLIFTYPRWKLDPTVWWQYLYPLGGVSVLAAFAMWARYKARPQPPLPSAANHAGRGPIAALLLFAGTLFPVLGFLNVYPFLFSFVADHFQYLASLAIIVPVASEVSRICGKSRAIAVILPAILGVLTWNQSAVYRDTETLYRVTLARNPDSWVTHLNLGAALLEMPGRLPEALTEFETTLRLRPDYAEAHMDRGSALAQIPGRLPEALTEFETTLRLQPDNPIAHNNRGSALARMPGRLPEALAEFETAVRLRPDYAEAHNDLGIMLTRVPGRLPDAIGEFHAALRSQPEYMQAHTNLGNALAQSGRLEEAIAEYRVALRIRPDDPETHNSLGIALSQIGRLPDAIAEYRTVLRMQPNRAETHNNLGNALARIPSRLAEAIGEYRAALRFNPDDAAAHNNLGNALARLPGHLADAIAEYQAALHVRPDYAQARVNLEAACAKDSQRCAHLKTKSIRP